MRHLSLCAGIGGIDLGLHRCIEGMRTVAMVEREAFCVSILEQKMRKGELDAAPIYPDLHRFPWSKYRGCVDIVSGGFPCQPFSLSGSRQATKDPRHLWPVITSGLAVLKPRACFFENVEGITSAESPGYHSVLHNVLCDLERLGYRSTAGRFTASETGAPHQRTRWFILGVSNTNCLHGSQHGEYWNFEESSVQGSTINENSKRFLKLQYFEREGTSAKNQVLSGQRWPASANRQQYEWEPPHTVECRVGGYSDGLPDKLDDAREHKARNRALGNAVVPAVAELAFSTLWYELNPERN
jgi:site-specific DNA-cytosine methylase